MRLASFPMRPEMCGAVVREAAPHLAKSNEIREAASFGGLFHGVCCKYLYPLMVHETEFLDYLFLG